MIVIGTVNAATNLLAAQNFQDIAPPSRSPPKGTVRALVARVLHDRPRLTAREILAPAGTDTEWLVKLGSIRAELQTGRKRGRYKSEGGRWSLTAPAPQGGDGAPDTSSSPGPDDAAGTPSDPSSSEAGPSVEPRDVTGAPAGDTPGEDVASGEPKTDADRGRLGMS